MESKPRSMRNEYVELGIHGNFDWAWTKPNKAPMVEKMFCPLKAGSAVHLVTSSVTLSSQILIAGSITYSSLITLRNSIIEAEESAAW